MLCSTYEVSGNCDQAFTILGRAFDVRSNLPSAPVVWQDQLNARSRKLVTNSEKAQLGVSQFGPGWPTLISKGAIYLNACDPILPRYPVASITRLLVHFLGYDAPTDRPKIDF